MIKGTRRNLPWLTAALAGATAALHAALGPAPAAWVYDRAAIGGGEWWRLVSGHWLHADGGHLYWNLVALLLLGSMVELRSRTLLIAALLSGSAGVAAMLWLASPALGYYCGLSGVLNALLLPAQVTVRRPADNGLLWLIGVLSLGKILVELASGQALFTHTLWASVPEAHLAGWLAGLLLLCCLPSRLRDMLPAGSDGATILETLSKGKPAA